MDAPSKMPPMITTCRLLAYPAGVVELDNTTTRPGHVYLRVEGYKRVPGIIEPGPKETREEICVEVDITQLQAAANTLSNARKR